MLVPETRSSKAADRQASSFMFSYKRIHDPLGLGSMMHRTSLSHSSYLVLLYHDEVNKMTWGLKTFLAFILKADRRVA
jgi:hypothetical protein